MTVYPSQVLTFLPTSPLVSLDEKIASSSSKKMTQGLHRIAVWKMDTTAFSDSPT